MKDALNREFLFAEWVRLSASQKRRLMTEYWDPTLPERGESTRGEILQAFGSVHPDLLAQSVSGTAFFSAAGWSIAVVVDSSSVRVPRTFDIFPVVKGVASNTDDPRGSVKWLER